jgi:SAM-dependent methyltransferase
MREYGSIVSMIAEDGPGRILDWGCGWGQMTQLLRGAGLEVAAFDYKPGRDPEGGMERLDRFPEIEAFISGDPRRLPYAAGEFDAVLSCGVLEHVEDPDASLDELRRVLRPGGTLYVYKLPNRYSYLEWVARRLGTYHHGAAPFDRLYTVGSAERLLEAHGYEVHSCRRANMLPLSLTGRAARQAAGAIWGVNRALSHVPGLKLLATNVELVATAPASSPGASGGVRSGDRLSE